jgi:DNA-binding response OmpR family regulator
MKAPAANSVASRPTPPVGPSAPLSVFSPTARMPYVHLTEKESALLKLLAGNAGRPVGQDEILTQLSVERHIDKNTLEVHVHNLRKKIRLCPQLRIDTVLNQGYMLSHTEPPPA